MNCRQYEYIYIYQAGDSKWNLEALIMGHLICPKGAQQRPQWTEGDQLLLSVPRYLHFTHPWCIILVNWLASNWNQHVTCPSVKKQNGIFHFSFHKPLSSFWETPWWYITDRPRGTKTGTKTSGWTELISADLSEGQILPYFFKVPERDRLTRSHEITIVTWGENFNPRQNQKCSPDPLVRITTLKF